MFYTITYKIRKCGAERKFSEIINILNRELTKFNTYIRPFKFVGIQEHEEDYTISLLLNRELLGLKPFNPLENVSVNKQDKQELIRELKTVAEVLEGLMNAILKLYGFPQVKVLEHTGSVSIPGTGFFTSSILDCTEQKELKKIGEKLLKLTDILPEKSKEALALFMTFYGLADITCEEGAVLQLGKCCEVLIRFNNELPSEIRNEIKHEIGIVTDINKKLNNFQAFFLFARHSNYLRSEKSENYQLLSRPEIREKIKEFSEKLAEVTYEIFRKLSAVQEK